MKYRKDINGLRSIAVMPVLFFHAGWELFSGGFLGVDVFFTISGYLITSLILKGLDESSFSILGFYDKRIRRIIPALLVILTITTFLSIFFMLPYALKNYGQSIVATVLSANNVLLYLTSGYWSLAAEFKPLYHTWSLGVEEQYYLIIPMLIIFCFKIASNKAKSYFYCLFVLFVLFVLSFFVSYVSDDREFNFLIIFSRMWELILGSIVALCLRNATIKSNSVISFLGLFLICFSYVYPYAFFNNQALVNLVPVIGVCLVIIFSSDEDYSGKFLSLRPLLFIGSISYSIYLFHMPILSLLRLSSNGRPDVIVEIVFTLLSIPLAYLTWKYIENPVRRRDLVSNKVFYSSVSILSCLLLSFGMLLHKTYGFQEYFPEYSYGGNPQAYADEPYKLVHDGFSLENKANLLIVGNSFARDFINMMKENNLVDKYEVIYLYDFSDIELSKSLLRSADIVISVSSAGMASRLHTDSLQVVSTELQDFILREFDGDLYRIGTKNFGWNNNFVRQMSYRDAIDFRVKPNKTSITANMIEKEIWGDRYIDVIGLLSDKYQTVRLFTPNGKFISFDTDHITRDGAKYLGELLLINTALKNLMDNTIVINN